MVLSKIRDRFGGNLKVSFVGGAATSMEVLNFFENIDIKILEGYGLTETSPLVTVNTPEQVTQIRNGKSEGSNDHFGSRSLLSAALAVLFSYRLRPTITINVIALFSCEERLQTRFSWRDLDQSHLSPLPALPCFASLCPPLLMFFSG